MPSRSSPSKAKRVRLSDNVTSSTAPKTIQRFVTSLLFVGKQAGKAEEAMRLYTSLFKNSKVIAVERYAVSEGDPEGLIEYARFSLDGHEFAAMDSSIAHNFSFTPAISTTVHCATASEVETLFSKLSDSGAVLMELGKYPFSDKFGWVQDKFGVSWQLMLA
jgi:predicted 3-demethylubiquinone-9 3-methyltransferase (glyoxalase superfamily)